MIKVWKFSLKYWSRSKSFKNSVCPIKIYYYLLQSPPKAIFTYWFFWSGEGSVLYVDSFKTYPELLFFTCTEYKVLGCKSLNKATKTFLSPFISNWTCSYSSAEVVII